MLMFAGERGESLALVGSGHDGDRLDETETCCVAVEETAVGVESLVPSACVGIALSALATDFD